MGHLSSYKTEYEREVVACLGAFSEPGLGGRESFLTGLDAQGGNPSVIWNAFLKRWVMTWQSWTGYVYISSSTDLLHWAPAVPLVAVRAPCPRLQWPLTPYTSARAPRLPSCPCSLPAATLA